MPTATKHQVSVIVPVYNPGPFLRAALAAVQRQTFHGWDVWVVDDGSTESLDWVQWDFPGVHLLRQPNRGSSVARNAGLLASQGELIAFLDQDDVWQPEKLARQVQALAAHPEAGLCHCDLRIIDAAGHAVDGQPWVMAGTPAPVPTVALNPSAPAAPGEPSALHRSIRYFSRRFVVPSTVMFRRSCLAGTGLLDPFIPFSGDYDFIIKLGSLFPVLHLPSADVGYRKHGDNFSDHYDVARREIRMLTARYRAHAQARGDRALAREAEGLFARPRRLFSAQAVDRARTSLRRGQRRETIYHLWRALCFSPWFVGESLWSWARAACRRAAARRREKQRSQP